MAENHSVTPTFTDVSSDRSVLLYSYSFTQTAGGDTANDTFTFAPIPVRQWADISVHAFGTATASANVGMLGSNEESPVDTVTNWATLYSGTKTASGDNIVMAMALTATPLLEMVIGHCNFARPNLSASPAAGTYTINVLVRRANPMRT